MLAQSKLPPQVLALSRLKRKVRSDMAALPNYTCVETIERWRRKGNKPTFQHVDTVHVEVAISGANEMYSWPGASRFETPDISRIIGAGTVSTGSFATEIQGAIGDASVIQWRGEEEISGRRANCWDYRIPYNLSGWTMTVYGHTGRVSAVGSFWADPESLELLRLETNADEIPPGMPIRAVKSVLTYAHVRVGSRDVLLPQSAELNVTSFDGEDSRNLMEFSHCREFGAESRLVSEVSTGDAPAVQPVAELTLPEGLRLPIRLSEAIDSKRTAVGDAISAVVESSAAIKGREVVPKGAVMRGRIRRMDRSSTPAEHFVVGLEFTEVEFSGHHARFFGEMESIDARAGAHPYLATSRTLGTTNLIYGGSITHTDTEMDFAIPIPGVSVFFLDGVSFRLPEGLRMTWRTVRLAK